MTKSFTNKEEFAKLKAFAETFVSRGIIDDFIAEFMPKMDSCLLQVSGYRQDNETMKTCVASMDEQMCNKANKISMELIHNRVEINHKYIHEEVPNLKQLLKTT